MGRGALIVFEGADRSGKTTQTVKCVEALVSAGVPIANEVPWRFPDRTTAIGSMINSYLTKATELNDRALHLLFSANRWEKADHIIQALEAGETVVLDRYAFSGVAYSAAKGLSNEWCKACDAGLPAPDIIIYLDLPLHIAAKRGHFGQERYENEKMQQAVSKQFETFHSSPSWHVIDANATQEVVSERVMDLVMPVVADIRTAARPVATLWPN